MEPEESGKELRYTPAGLEPAWAKRWAAAPELYAAELREFFRAYRDAAG